MLKRVDQRGTVLSPLVHGELIGTCVLRIDGDAILVQDKEIHGAVMVRVPNDPGPIAIGVELFDFIHVPVKIRVRFPPPGPVYAVRIPIRTPVKIRVFDTHREGAVRPVVILPDIDPAIMVGIDCRNGGV